MMTATTTRASAHTNTKRRPRYDLPETQLLSQPNQETAILRRMLGSASQYRTTSPPGARDPYAIPGAFKEKEVDEVKEVKVRYGDRREKDYYVDKEKEVEGVKIRYGDRWEKDYYTDKKQVEDMKVRYGDRREKDYYADKKEVEEVKVRYSDRRDKDYYTDKEKEVEEVKVRYGDRREKDYYAESSYERRDEYGRRVSPPERSRYSEAETYKHPDPRDRERERERERDWDPRRHEEERHGKERVASFNIHAGHSSISGGINIEHENHDRPQYAQPPSPAPHGQPYPPSPYGARPASPPNRLPSYAEPKQWEYAQPDEKITYTRRTESTTSYGAPSSYGARPPSPPQPEYLR